MKENFKPVYFLSLLLFSLPSGIQASDLCNTNDAEFKDKYYYPSIRFEDSNAYEKLSAEEKPNFLKKELIQSVKHVLKMRQATIDKTCSLHKGTLYYLMGVSTLRRELLYVMLRNVHKELTPFEEIESTRLIPDAKMYFEEAEKEFVKVVDLQDSDKFQAIYNGKHGPILFHYAHTIKNLERLATTPEEKISYLTKLMSLVTELSKNPDMCLNASSGGGMTTDYHITLFSQLGYADRLKTSVNIDQLFLDDPQLLLYSIDLKRSVLKNPETDVTVVLNEWVPKFKPSTQVALRLIIKEAQPEASTSQ